MYKMTFNETGVQLVDAISIIVQPLGTGQVAQTTYTVPTGFYATVNELYGGGAFINIQTRLQGLNPQSFAVPVGGGVVAEGTVITLKSKVVVTDVPPLGQATNYRTGVFTIFVYKKP
jgi:hypothetical protein